MMKTRKGVLLFAAFWGVLGLPPLLEAEEDYWGPIAKMIEKVEKLEKALKDEKDEVNRAELDSSASSSLVELLEKVPTILQSLTQDQLLIMARQCARYEEEKEKERGRPFDMSWVSWMLDYYRRKGFSEESFEKFLSILQDNKEPDILRAEIAHFLTWRGKKDEPLIIIPGREERAYKTLRSLLQDKTVSKRVRRSCCISLWQILWDIYRDILYSDPAVKAEREKQEKSKQPQNIESLIDAGEVKLSEETKKRLEEPRKWVHEFLAIAKSIQEAPHEPKDLRDAAKDSIQRIKSLTEISMWPLLYLEEKDRDSVLPKK